jgi:hypothetical protein
VIKKAHSKKQSAHFETEDMLPEYDFKNMKGGVRGKYSKAYRNGHTVKIHGTDETRAELREYNCCQNAEDKAKA